MSGGVVIYAPGRVGDFIMATPAFRALRRFYRQEKLRLYAKPGLYRLVEGEGWLDGGYARGRRADWFRLRRDRPRLGVVLANSWRGPAAFWLAGIPERVGYGRGARKALLNRHLPAPRKDGKYLPVAMVDYYLELCRFLGIPPTVRSPVLELTPGQREEGQRFRKTLGVQEGQPLVLIAPGAGYGPAKCWPPESFATVSELLVKRRGARMALLHGPGEEELAGKIRAHAGETVWFPERTPDLGQVKAWTGAADLVVGNDSGYRHVAAALGIPSVTLMGPTEPIWSTYENPADRVLRKEVPCGPCMERTCPEGHHRCMTAIAVEEVLAAVDELWERYDGWKKKK